MTNQLLMKIIISFFLSVLLVNPAIALGVKEYKQLKKESPDFIKTFIGGIGAGYSYSNIVLEKKGRPPLYCPPSKVALNASNYVQIIDKKIVEFKKIEFPDTVNVDVELLLYLGLVEAFPCTK